MIADTNTIHTNPTKPTRRSCQLAEPDVATEADSDAAGVEFVGFDPISSSIIGAVGDTIPASAVDMGPAVPTKTRCELFGKSYG